MANGIRTVFALTVLLGCSGCMAAGIAVTGAALARGGYSMYKMGEGQSVAVQIKEQMPSGVNLARIRNADMIAVIPPSGEGLDFSGSGIDILREKTRLAVVSPVRVEEALEARGHDDVAGLPTREMVAAAQYVAVATEADLALVGKVDGTEIGLDEWYFFGSGTEVKTPIEVIAVAASNGEVVWRETHTVLVEGRGAQPPASVISDTVYGAIAKRLNDIRKTEVARLAGAR